MRASSAGEITSATVADWAFDCALCVVMTPVWQTARVPSINRAGVVARDQAPEISYSTCS